jgi:hypothetical protein
MMYSPRLKSAEAHADEGARQIHQIISEVAVHDERGTNAGANIREAPANANTVTQNLAEHTEALKHNFLLRGLLSTTRLLQPKRDVHGEVP